MDIWLGRALLLLCLLSLGRDLVADDIARFLARGRCMGHLLMLLLAGVVHRSLCHLLLSTSYLRGLIDSCRLAVHARLAR